MLRNPGKPLSIYEVAACVGKAHAKALTPTNIMSAFSKTGIFSYDRTIFTDLDFLPSSVTDRPLASSQQQILPREGINILSDINIPLTLNIISTSENQTSYNNHDLVITNKHHSPQPSTSGQNFISPEQFRGLPKAAPRKSGGGRRKGKSIIATDTPEKNAIADRETERRKKKIKCIKKDILKMKEVSSDEDISMPEYISDVSSTGDIDDEDILKPDPSCFEKLRNEPKSGDYVLIEFISTIKNKKKFYIGKIICELNEEESEYEVSFLKKSCHARFVIPDLPDIAVVLSSDIKMILPPPTVIAATRRKQTTYMFEIDFSLIDIR